MKKPNESVLRIIGGRFRGRKIHFPIIPGLRPTADRIRETLFNWLAPHIVEASCLDCFAGSGILSFEAISRGAKWVFANDQSPIVISHLKKTRQLLQLNNLYIIHSALPAKLQLIENSIDIVFLDPPFQHGYIKMCCEWLENSNYLKPNALIYIEAEKELDPLPIPANWEILKNKIAGNVRYCLVIKANSNVA